MEPLKHPKAKISSPLAGFFGSIHLQFTQRWKVTELQYVLSDGG